MMSMGKAFHTWLDYIDSAKTCILATVLQTEITEDEYVSKQLFINKKMELTGSLGNDIVDRHVMEIAQKKFTEKTPSSETISLKLTNNSEIHVFIDIHLPPINVMIFGAGHDAIPVATYSNALGLNTTVVDARPHYNSEKNFPNTKRIIVRDTDFEEKLTISENTYVIVMNHHIDKDKQTLKFVLNSPAAYVGVLGPLSRRNRMLDALQKEGVTITAKELQKMYSPIGLDIGASTPEEIAMSILTEIIAIRNGHAGGFLKGSEFIHQHSNANS